MGADSESRQYTCAWCGADVPYLPTCTGCGEQVQPIRDLTIRELVEKARRHGKGIGLAILDLTPEQLRQADESLTTGGVPVWWWRPTVGGGSSNG